MRRFVALRILTLSILACSLPYTLAAQEPLAAEAELAGPAVDIESLQAEIRTILEENEVPGASIALVARDHTIWAGGVGLADVAAGVEVTADHLFRVGSISKSFTALAVLRAVEDGLIDLDAPVRSLAPEIEFTNRWEATHPVTVAMVMEHTAGFDDIRAREYAKVDDPDMTLRQGLAYNPSSRVCRWKPGTYMSYCNSGPAVAAYILEQVTGTAFEDFVNANVFEVLGMESATFHLPNDPSRMAKGYEDGGETTAHYDHIIVRPSGALNASARDMARYLRMMINRGTLDGVELLRPQTITRMETPTTALATQAGFDFGYGLGNYSSVVNGHLFHGHNGGITGFVSTSAYSSDLGVGFFVSINRPSGALREIGRLVGERLTASFEAPAAPTAELSTTELEAVAGFYQNVTPRQEITRAVDRLFAVERVVLDQGELYTRGLFDDERELLIPVTATTFRREDQPLATRFHLVNDEGDLIAQSPLGTNARKVSGFWVYLKLATAALTVLLMLSSVLFALVWVPLKAFGRLQRVPLRIVLMPLLATLSGLAAFVVPLMLISDMVHDLGTRTGISLAIFVGSLVFAVLTVWSLVTAYRAYSADVSRLARLHGTLVSLACLVTVIYLGGHGLIGVRTWVL